MNGNFSIIIYFGMKMFCSIVRAWELSKREHLYLYILFMYVNKLALLETSYCAVFLFGGRILRRNCSRFSHAPASCHFVDNFIESNSFFTASLILLKPAVASSLQEIFFLGKKTGVCAEACSAYVYASVHCHGNTRNLDVAQISSVLTACRLIVVVMWYPLCCNMW